jgi:hypothetical protein
VSRQNPDPNRLVSVFENVNGSLLWIARDELASVGVESFIIGENLARIAGSMLPSLFPARLMVYADKADEARQCLRDLGFEK